MHKGFLRIGAVAGMLSVILGAFAAHALKGMVGDHAIATFETGVRYQFYHALALLLTGMLFKEFNTARTLVAGWLFLAGIILFSGSLYFLTYIQASVQPGMRWVGAITPFGGLCFIGGWLLLFWAFWSKKKS